MNTINISNGTQWYFRFSMVCRSFICYHSKYHWDQQIYLLFNGTERYWTALNGIEWYWIVFEWYTVGRFW